MPDNIFALGMFVRFAPGESQSANFYEQVVELPLVRNIASHAQVYWGGEALMYELVYVKDKQLAPETDPATAPCVPVFRVHDLDAIVAVLRSRGADVFGIHQRALGREAHFRDSSGYLMGLRERSEASTLEQDVEARRRWLRGEAYNPGCKSMPEGWQELGWLVRHVADLSRMTKFYAEVMGLRQIGAEENAVLFDLGDNTILEVAPGGRAQPVPGDRYQGPSGAVLRVHHIQQIREAVAGGGGHIVNNAIPGLHWAELMYFADPEGVVFGAEKAHHPGTYAPQKFVLPENLEAERREIERLALSRVD
jgi:predicted enzyme related to lactoylglutathione lyase